MAEQNPKERIVIIVDSVGNKREPSAGNPVINFSAHREDTKEGHGYEAWGNDLVDLIVKDARLDCEVTTITKNDQVTYRVTQIWDENGKPVRETTRRQSRGGTGKSDEQVRLEIVEREGEAAYAGVISLLSNKIITPTHDLAATALDYAEAKMKAAMGGSKPASKPAAKAEQKKPAEKPAEKPAPAPKKETSDESPITEEMIEKLRKVATKMGYTRESSTALIKSFGVDSVNKLNMKQAHELLEKIEKGEGATAEKEEAPDA